MQNADAAAKQIVALKPTVDDFTPAFKQLAQTDRVKADAFAVAYVRSLQSHDQLALHFDQVSRMPDTDRLAILAANRDGGNGMSVIHAAALLPAAQGQVLMKGFMNPTGVVIDRAARDFADWLASAGTVLREKNVPIPAENVPHDDLLGRFYECRRKDRGRGEERHRCSGACGRRHRDGNRERGEGHRQLGGRPGEGFRARRADCRKGDRRSRGRCSQGELRRFEEDRAGDSRCRQG